MKTKNKIFLGLLMMCMFLISSLVVSAAVTISSTSPATKEYLYDGTAFSSTVTTPENETVSTATLAFAETSLDITVTNVDNASDTLSYTFDLTDGVPNGAYDAVLTVTTNDSNTATETLNYVVNVQHSENGLGIVVGQQVVKSNKVQLFLMLLIIAIVVIVLYSKTQKRG